MRNRIIDTLNLGITTYCNRNCSDCCVGTNIPSVGKHTDFEWIKNISKYFQKLDKVTVTGGEPLLNPEFKWISTRLKRWFNSNKLELITNGSGKLLLFHWETLHYYDSIRITNYTSETYKGSKDNTDAVKRFVGAFKFSKPSISIIIERPIFKTKIGNGGMCGMGKSSVIAIQNKKLYPCCVSPGLQPDVGIEITDNWLNEIRQVKIPCAECVFSI